MFKSLFSKYISAFLLINLFSFAVIISIITSIINGYSQKTQRDELKMVTLSAREYIESQAAISESRDLNNVVSSNTANMGHMFSALSSNSEAVTIVVADESGKILSSFGTHASDIESSAFIPADFLDFFKNNEDTEEFLVLCFQILT